MYEYDRQKLIEYINELRGTFDVARVVDPIKNTVIISEDIDDTLINYSCYDFWKKGKACDNCISFRSINEEKTTTKIEYSDQNVYLVISTPILLNNKKYAIEMLLNINEIDTIKYINKENNEKLQKVITNLEENLLVDELTGVYNRRFINKSLARNMKSSKSDEMESVVLIMVDIDNFKEINDTYGHLTGDKVIRKIASIIESRIRSDFDWVARYGGDEFIILLKNADESVANKVIRDIQKEIKEFNLLKLGCDTEITLSFGAHIFMPGTMNFEKVLEIVDNNLKKAKCSGKNKAIIS